MKSTNPHSRSHRSKHQIWGRAWKNRNFVWREDDSGSPAAEAEVIPVDEKGDRVAAQPFSADHEQKWESSIGGPSDWVDEAVDRCSQP